VPAGHEVEVLQFSAYLLLAEDNGGNQVVALGQHRGTSARSTAAKAA
jgi:hypothetical protein